MLFQRIQARGRAQDKYETPQFATRIRDRYISLYERNSTRMTLIDTTRRSFEDVEAMVMDYIDNFIIVEEPCHE
jgi:thymidylate kinase